MNPLGNQGAPRRRGNDAFFGQDSGTRFSEEARQAIEHGDEGAGHKGNNVDISQRTADDSDDVGGGKRGLFFSVLPGDDDAREKLSQDLKDNSSHGDTRQGEADEYTEQAERMTRDLERYGKNHLGFGFLADPEKRAEYVEGLADLLRGKPARPAQPQGEKEAPFLNRKSDDEFWASDEPKKVMPKRL